MSDELRRERAPASSWYALVLLGVVYTIYNIDRNLVVILSEPIRKEFGLSDTQLGLLTGTSFAVAFAIAGIPLGFLVDRTHRVRLISGLLAIWSVATMVCGVVRGFTMLLIARIVVGGAESGAAPTALSILSDSFPKASRGTAIGLFYLATPAGLAVGYAIGGFLAQHIGWREVFLIAGAPGVVLALVTLFTIKEPRRGAFEAPTKGPELVSSFGVVTAVLRKKKTLLLLMLGAITVVIAQSGIGAFLPSLLIRRHGLALDQVGLYVALIMGVGGAIGMPLGGMMSDFLSKRSVALVPRAVGGLILVSAVFAIAACLAPGIEMSVGLFFVYAILVQAYLAPTLATFISLSPPGLRGAMSGFLFVAMNLIGFGVGPQLTGIISDQLAAAGVVQPLAMAMVAISSFFVVSSLIYMLAGSTSRRDAELVEQAAAKPA